MIGHLTRIAFGFVGCAMLAELVLRLFPVSTGNHYQPVNAENPVLRGASHVPYTYSLGWNFRRTQHGLLNNDGFAAVYDYQAESPAPILLIGDSFVQAAATTPGRRLHEVLSMTLAPRHVFALGRPGGSLPDYLALAQWGRDRYRPAAIIILISVGDVDDSVDEKPGGYSFVLSPAGSDLIRRDRPPYSPLENLINGSSLFRYAYDNLGLHANMQPAKPENSAADLRNAVSTAFLDRLAAVYPASRTLIVFNKGRREGSFNYSSDTDTLLELAHARGLQLLELPPLLADYEARTGLRVDEYPVDIHWNARAAAVVAGGVSRSLGIMLTRPINPAHAPEP